MDINGRSLAMWWVTVIQWAHGGPAGRSLVRFPMVSLEFFIDITLPAALWSTQPLTEMSTGNISWGGVKAVGA